MGPVYKFQGFESIDIVTKINFMSNENICSNMVKVCFYLCLLFIFFFLGGGGIYVFLASKQCHRSVTLITANDSETFDKYLQVYAMYNTL